MRQTSVNLAALDGIAHDFYGREGGASSGIYATLNCGAGSKDAPEAVSENRERVRRDIGANVLLSLPQIHSNKVVTITQQMPLPDPRPEADAMVTNLRGVALGILTADCAPVLFADAKAGIIGAAHAGWKGAVSGVLENTLAAMQALGAQPNRVVAAIGPCIAQASYEVGEAFAANLIAHDARAAAFIDAQYHFNLPAYVLSRLLQMGLASAEDLAIDTYSNEARYFSYRRCTHAGEADYGRQLSVIMMKDTA